MNKSTSTFLDCARWLAAFFVVFGHAAHMLIPDRYFLTELGHCAVVVFFVVSGYLVGGTTLAKWRDRGVDLVGYSAARFSRIYIVLVPALALGYLLDTLGLRYFDAYAHLGSLNIGSLDNVEPRLGVKQLVGNFLMLQGTATEVLGSNGPLWSLANEWWYYCLFLFIAGGALSRGVARYMLWACAVPLLVLLDKNLLLWGVLWLAGLGAYFIRWRMPTLVGAAAFIASLVVWQLMEHQYALLRDAIVAVGFCALLLSKIEVPFAKLHEPMAAFSYSLYLIHFPLMLMICALFGWRLGASSALYIPILVVAVYVLSYGFARLTEKHTNVLRSWLLRTYAKIWKSNVADSRTRVVTPSGAAGE